MHKIYKLLNNDFYCYLLGAFHGDGNSIKNGICFTIDKKNKGYINNLISLIKSTYLDIVPSYKEYKVGKLYIYSKDIASHFSPLKSNYKWTLPNLTSIKHYLSGIIDTDGSISVRGGKVSCIITQKTSSNIELASNLFNLINVDHRIKLNIPYQNNLGNFHRSELHISHRDNIIKLFDFPLLNPNRVLKLNQAKQIYLNCPRRRQNGELDTILFNQLGTPKSMSDLVKLTGCTQGNLNYKLLKMISNGTVSRKNIDGIYIYEKI